MDYQDGFGRRGRFGTVAPPQIPQFPNIDERPPRPAVNRAPDVPQLDIGTPGGLAQNLQAAGASRAYALKQALQLNRQQQGALNNPGNYAANGRGAAADNLTAPFTGTPFAGQQRQMNDASLQRYQSMTPLLETDQVYKNEDQRIRNQFAPGVINAGINRTNAETGLTTARTAGVQGDETRAQGRYGMEMQQAPARFEQEMAGAKAKTGLTEAQTRGVDAEAGAMKENYSGRIQQMEASYKQQSLLLRNVLSELSAARRAQGKDDSDIAEMLKALTGDTGTKPADPVQKVINNSKAGDAAATSNPNGINVAATANPAGTAPPMTPAQKPAPPAGATDNGDGTVRLGQSNYRFDAARNGWVKITAQPAQPNG